MVSITVRNVPDEVRDELAARAARSGRSLQEYLRSELIRMTSKPGNAEVMRRVAERVQTYGTRVTDQEVVDMIHDAREERAIHIQEILDERDRRL